MASCFEEVSTKVKERLEFERRLKEKDNKIQQLKRKIKEMEKLRVLERRGDDKAK